jgi:rhamnosyltransferase
VTATVGQQSAPSIGVVIITHKARDQLRHCLPPLLASPLRPRVMVVNSSSGDGTVEEARRLGAEVLVVPREEFNHGLTRERARRALGTDIVVMLTPDAFATDESFLDRLTRPIRDGLAAVSYGRQLPRADAGLVERYGRDFNYPARSQLRSLADWWAYGSYTHFCSNACAAWSNAALDAVGGFPATLVSEETVAVARLLRAGHRIAYVAHATVVHSHDLGLAGELKRHFDIGYTRRFADLLREPERDEVRGRAFARGLLAQAWREDPASLPSAAAHLAAKWLGYRLGLLGPALPLPLAARLSGQDYFWRTAAARPALQPTLAAAG